ncbi:MAG TPA: glycosyltransferase family 87 protein [Pseudoduganella sp.]
MSVHWLNEERLRVYPRIMLTLFVTITIIWLCLYRDMVDPRGMPVGADFITFWGASRLALEGNAPSAYDLQALMQAEQAAVPALRHVFGWYYPPTFFLVILPLGLMPYLLAYIAFSASTLAAYAALLRRILADKRALVCLLAFPGLWVNLWHGQNAFLTASLAAGALLLRPTMPALSGVLIGLLAIKPHLAILFLPALAAAREWRIIAVAAVTACAMAAAGTLMLGDGMLPAFGDGMRIARQAFESGALPWVKMPTMFAQLRLLGVPVDAAYALHSIVAGLVVAAIWLVWRSVARDALKNAALMCGTLLVTPYLFDYDLAWLAFPLAWMALEGLHGGWRAGERNTLVLAWLLPVLMSSLANLTGLIQLGPWVTGLLLCVITRRALGTSA